MLRHQNEYESFIRLEYLYRGFLEAFEEEIGDVYEDRVIDTPYEYRYDFYNKKSHIRISNKTPLNKNHQSLVFKIDFNSDFSNFKKCTTVRYKIGNNIDTDYHYDKNPSELIDKFKWLLEHNKPEYRKKLSDGVKKISAFSSIQININDWGTYSKSSKWNVCILSTRMKIDLGNPNVGRDVYQFFKKVLLSVSLIS